MTSPIHNNFQIALYGTLRCTVPYAEWYFTHDYLCVAYAK